MATTRKLKTKAQREAEQRRALFRRLCDIYTGATDDFWGPDHEEDDYYLPVEHLPRVFGAVMDTFGLWKTNKEVLGLARCATLALIPEHPFQPGVPRFFVTAYSLDKFETVHKLTNHLFEHGVRA